MIGKFDGLEPRRCEDMKGFVEPKIGPKGFGTFEKQAPAYVVLICLWWSQSTTTNNDNDNTNNNDNDNTNNNDNDDDNDNNTNNNNTKRKLHLVVLVSLA